MKRLWIIVFLAGLGLAARAQSPLLISEVLYQPVSGEAEYVELYNAGDTALELADYRIVRVLHDTLAGHYPLPSHTVEPHGYVVLSKDVESVGRCFRVPYPSRLVECRLPAFPNEGGSVVLAWSDSTVADRLDYSPSMHSRLLRNRAGVSLERRRFDRPAAEASNWFSASSTSGYGTPGYANSQSTEWLVEESAFELRSTLVSPDGDGYQDVLTVDYRMDDASLAARVEVYDGRGRRVRRLLNDALLGAAGQLDWDGRDDNGGTLPRGQYVLLITVYDTAGTRQTLRRTVALVD